MSEHPIPFSSEMVRAILDGRKTQTRRVIKPQFGKVWGSGVPFGYDRFGVHVDIPLKEPDPKFGGWTYLFCPYGRTGDRLWVRETLVRCQDSEASEPLALYAGMRNQVYRYGKPARWEWKTNVLQGRYSPRWASRITLEVIKVRAERVQDISPFDALAEGIEDDVAIVSYPGTRQQIEDAAKKIAVERFCALWDSINAKRGYPWESNPWVWVIEFRRTT